MSAPLRHVALVGLGWHARRIYLPWIATAHHQGRVALVAVVDHERNALSVKENLESWALDDVPLHLASAPDEAPEGDGAILKDLDALRAAGRLDGLIVSTDPRVRRPYILWALSRGVDVLVDKPLTAPPSATCPLDVAAFLEADLALVTAAAQRSPARLVLMAQRRAHPGYLRIYGLVKEISERYGVPVTHLDLSHADGMWVMPWEWDRDHHAYKHGTGKLLHSGYHFVDVAAWLLGAGDALRPPGEAPAVLELSAVARTPADTVAVTAEAQARLFGPGSGPPPGADLRAYGEHDVVVQGALRRAGHLEATLSLQLLQSSFSRRASADPPEDPYKGAGRVRHERLTLHLGPLMSIHVHSYQAKEIREVSAAEAYGPGGIDHFDLDVYRNTGLIGGSPFERFELGRDAGELGHNEEARHRLLEAFIDGHPTGSDLGDHARSIRCTAAIYRALQRRIAGSAGLERLWFHS